jgi:AraC-like DNA-binding protein
VSDDHGIGVSLLRPLAGLLGRIGADEPAFLAALGVTPDTPPTTYIDSTHVDAALAAIAERRGDAAFALTLATSAAGRPLGLFGHIVWLSSTLGDALGRAVANYGLITRRSVLTLEGARIISRPVGTSPRGRILTELPFASLALRAREATAGAFVPRAVRFTHAGSDDARYLEVFGVPVTFDAALDEVELDPAQLALPLVGADPLTLETLEAKVRDLTASREPTPDNFVERVRRIALDQLEASPDDIARTLGISTRTLRRRLDDHGISFRGVVDDVRRALADELLGRGKTVKEVAFALGFSEPSAFSRAYKRWAGKAPTQR